MNKNYILDLLEKLKEGRITIDEAYNILKDLPFKDLGDIKIDYHREIRKDLPETIFCQGKRKEQVIKIIDDIKGKANILATKASEDLIDFVSKKYPEAELHKDAGIIFIGKYPELKYGKVLILTAGSADLGVATEASIVLKCMGVQSEIISDVGVAGIHRLLNFKEQIEKSDVIIVVAGMDGVLPTFVAGLFPKPVIAVPTSIGYGANFSGLAPLLTMLNSCSPGVVVVNIDNGYGAGYFAGILIKKLKYESNLYWLLFRYKWW